MSRDRVEGVAKILAQAHPAESLGNIAREIIAFLDNSKSPERLSEAVLREKIKVAIGYDPVPLSIRDHPEITFEYRTITDRDGLVDRISAALLPSLKSTWLAVDLMFRDRSTGEVRHAPGQTIEIVMMAPNQILFQDLENGTHRLVALEHIEGIRLAGNVVWNKETGELT